MSMANQGTPLFAILPVPPVPSLLVEISTPYSLHHCDRNFSLRQPRLLQRKESIQIVGVISVCFPKYLSVNNSVSISIIFSG